MTPAQLQAIENAKARLSQTQQQAVSSARSRIEPNAAQKLQSENPLLRTAGRGGRSIVGGLSSLADLALLVPKTLASGAEVGLEAMGSEGSPLEQFAQKIRSIPTMRDSTVGLVDQATGNTLQPQGNIEKATDFINETISSSLPMSKAQSFIPEPPTSMDALRSLASPQDLFKKNPPRVTSEQLRQGASQAYQRATQAGGILKPEATDNFLDTLQKTVAPQDAVVKALSKDDPANEVMSTFESMLRGTEMDLDRLQALDEFLSTKIDGFIENGRVKKEGYGLQKIQEALRDMVENADETMIKGGKEGFESLTKARDLWSRQAKLRDVEKIITRAELSEQPANAIKSGFRSLYNNEKKMRGFTKAEREAVKKAAETGIAGELLRTTASRLFGIGSAVTGGPMGYAAGKGIEMASRGAGTALQINKANALADLIAQGGPKPYQPLLTNQGALATLGASNNILNQ